MSQHQRAQDLRYETFPIEGELGTTDDRGAAFIRAIDYGFLEAPRGEVNEIAQLDRFRTDGTLLTAAYDDAPDPLSVGVADPVGTFGDFVGSVCVRDDVIVPTQMVTEVTVRGTHRRRGILTEMMTSALRRGQDSGLPLAALTASEGGIYGRYGFGAAAYSQRITVAVSHGLRLRADVRAALADAGYRSVLPTWETFGAVYPDLYARFQAHTPGQTGATHAYRRRALGDANAWAVADAEKPLRPLLIVDGDGVPVAFALTAFSGWDNRPHRLTIADLGAVDPLAEIALWEALGATDLVDELVWREAPTDLALPAALVDARDVTFGERMDHLWLRVLDMVGAFTARGLHGDGALILDVTDRRDLITGRWVVAQSDGETIVRPAAADDAPVLHVDAETLATIYLGTVGVETLVALGRAQASAADLPALARLLDTTRAPRNSYTF